jgi:cellulose synthase/poly-beta-1,6-N-acetylglucosamine synthase-like glycosyltransferase
MFFSIVIATYNRLASLELLLSSIAAHFVPSVAEHEIIVANNARDPGVAIRIDELVKKFQRDCGTQFRLVREPKAGKCKAQNAAIGVARGKVLAFFDDDIMVTPDWLSVAKEFFTRSTYDAMQGAILVPPEMEGNQDFLVAQQKFKTINFLQYRSPTKELRTLTGANMAIRREVFSKIGLFNERLGPGRSGISEDVEFAQRLIRSGGRIGFEPKAAVYHEVDWSRLTEEFFRERHEQQGRSRLIFKRQALPSIFANLVRSSFTFGWYSCFGNVRKQYRAKGRFFHYRAMLLEKIRKPHDQPTSLSGGIA